MRLPRRRSRRGRTEQGAIAIIVALSLTALLIITAMVLDFGLARLDRQENKSAADNAVAAGIRGFPYIDDGQIYPYSGVCAALGFLRANLPSLQSLAWAPCDPANPAHVKLGTVCDSSNNATWADYTGSANGYTVRIESPYTLPDPAFPEDSLSSTASDVGSPCDQIAVIITQKRSPGLGSLATSSDLTTTVRSVGRVDIVPGDRPPALILLDRTHCGVLTVGSSGSPSKITVKGVGPVPGTIHADSDASDSGCGSGSNQQLFQGHQTDGIVAYAAQAADPATGTVDPGSISSVATQLHVASGVVSDGITNVHGTDASGAPLDVTGRELVTRKPVDRRYLAGVTSLVEGAYPQWTQNHLSPTGYTHYGCPSATEMTTLAGLSAADSVYIDCPGNSGITLNGTIGAGRIYFHGFIKGGTLRFPNAQTIYIDDSDNSGAKVNSDALSLSNNNAFCVKAPACDPTLPSTGQCTSAATGNPLAKTQIVLRRGRINTSGGLLRMCNTTVIMESGQLGAGTAANPGGCLPVTWGAPPTTTPCPGASSTAGTGQIVTSGYTDWTAPNAIGSMTGLSESQKQALWNGGEDLALWTESYGTGPDFSMAGGGEMHVAGVFMAPNAAPFRISGSGAQDLTEAQYVVTSFAVDGGASLTMGVDEYSAVPPPVVGDFTMVR